jgi:uncharacterized membrane protein YidH (DUF202 family)
MGAIPKYLDTWNNWIVVPIVLLVAVFTFITWRRSSLLLVALGAALYITSSLFQVFNMPPGQVGFNPALMTQYIGLVLSMTGLAWLWQKDRQVVSARVNAVRYRDVH